MVNRSRKRLKAMLGDLELESGSNGIEAHQLGKLRRRLEASSWDFVFNATPVAIEKMIPSRCLSAGTVVFEAAYGLRGRARPPAARVIGGIDMLIYQALSGFEIMTGFGITDYRRMKAAIKRGLAI